MRPSAPARYHTTGFRREQAARAPVATRETMAGLRRKARRAPQRATRLLSAGLPRSYGMRPNGDKENASERHRDFSNIDSTKSEEKHNQPSEQTDRCCSVRKKSTEWEAGRGKRQPSNQPLLLQESFMQYQFSHRCALHVDPKPHVLTATCVFKK